LNSNQHFYNSNLFFLLLFESRFFIFLSFNFNYLYIWDVRAADRVDVQPLVVVAAVAAPPADATE
jgi:hypothetical protein